MRPTRMFAAAVLAVFAGGLALAQEKVENPEYASWAKHKKGTAVTLKSTTVAGAINSESVITTTLADIGADSLTVEMAVTSKVNGMEFKNPPIKREIAKSVALPAGVKKEDFGKVAAGAKAEEGTETVKVGGAEYKAKWYKSKTKAGDGEVESKVWMSDDVPGGLLKTVATTTGATPATVTLEVVEVKKP